MSFVRDNLMPGEVIVYETKLHWIVFVPAILFGLMGLLMIDGEITVALFWFAVAALLACVAQLKRDSSEFAVTNRRVYAKIGVVGRKTMEMHLSKIESLSIDQGVFGQMFGYGTIKMHGTGSGSQEFKKVAAALEVRRHVYAQTERGAAAGR